MLPCQPAAGQTRTRTAVEPSPHARLLIEMKRFRILLLVLVALVSAPIVYGQTSDQNSRPPTDPARFNTDIVVTPERGETPRNLVSSSIVVLDDATIATLPVVHPSEVLEYLPGFTAIRPEFTSGLPVVSARGFFGAGEAEYILLLVDGVPVSDVESGLIDWSMLPTASMQRVEASRGPGAALYGDSAVGGVIQILTRRPQDTGQLTVTGGSFSTFTADGSYGRRVRGIGLSFTGATRTTDGAVDHAGGRQSVASGSGDGQFNGFSWRANVSGGVRTTDNPGALTRNQFAVAPYSSDPLFRFDTLDRHNVSATFTLRHQTDSWRPQARVYVTTRDEDSIQTVLLAPRFGDTRARALSSHVAGGSLEGGHAFSAPGSPLIRFGVDISTAHLDTAYRSVNSSGVIGALNSQATGDRVRGGAFASGSWAPVARVSLSGAIRWDDVGDRGFGPAAASSTAPQRAWSPRAGVVVKLTENGDVTLYGQASKAFKAPTLGQRFDPRPYPDFHGGSILVSNPDLVPQRATNLEAGISGSRGPMRVSALAYRMTVDNEIDFDLRSFRYANIGTGRHTGVELEAEGRWVKWITPSMTYALARVTEVGGDTQLKNIPRHVLSAAVAMQLPWSIGAYVRYNHRWDAWLDDANTVPIHGPSTVDLRVRRPAGRYTLFADVLNATSNAYEEFGYTLPDFRGNVVSYVYAGAPRAARAGVTIAF